jgi:hypothetical protein
LRGIAAQVTFHIGVDCLQLRVRSQIGDVLADAFEKQLHGVVDLADLAPAAVDKLSRASWRTLRMINTATRITGRLAIAAKARINFCFMFIGLAFLVR